MVSQDRRAHQRYPAWFPINVRIDDDLNPRAAMLCDISLGGALVWGFWDDQGGERAALEVTFRSDSSSIPARIVSVERQWDTVILHLQFINSVHLHHQGLLKLPCQRSQNHWFKQSKHCLLIDKGRFETVQLFHQIGMLPHHSLQDISGMHPTFDAFIGNLRLFLCSKLERRRTKAPQDEVDEHAPERSQTRPGHRDE